MDMSEELFCVEIKRKNAGPEARQMHFMWKSAGSQVRGQCFVGACAVETRMDFSKEPWKLIAKHAAHSFWGRHFVLACAVETHMDISEEPFCVEISRKMLDPTVTTSIEYRVFYCDRKNALSVWLHCLGKEV